MSLRSHVTMALFSVALGLTCSAQAAPLTAGSPPSSAPTTFLDTKTGKIEGFMPDVAAEVAKRQKLDINFTAVPFSTLIQSVIAGKIDMIVAGMTPTPERENVLRSRSQSLRLDRGWSCVMTIKSLSLAAGSERRHRRHHGGHRLYAGAD